MPPAELLSQPDETLLHILTYVTHATASEDHRRRPDSSQTIAFYHRTISHLSACKKLRSLAIDSYYHDRVFNFDLSIAKVDRRKYTKKVHISERGTFGDAAEIYGGVLSLRMKLHLYAHMSNNNRSDFLVARAKQILEWCTKAKRVEFEIDVRANGKDELNECGLGNIVRRIREQLKMVVIDVSKGRKKEFVVQYND